MSSILKHNSNNTGACAKVLMYRWAKTQNKETATLWELIEQLSVVGVAVPAILCPL